MCLINFFKNINNNRQIIYVLESLLYIKTYEDSIKKHKHLDSKLYNILTNPDSDIYQKIFHEGCLPIINKQAQTSDEFRSFINNLANYITFDLQSDSVFAQIAENQQAQKDVIEKVRNSRKYLIEYLYDKKLISEDLYEQECNHKVSKPLF